MGDAARHPALHSQLHKGIMLETILDRLASLAITVLQSSTPLIWLVEGDRPFIKSGHPPGRSSDSAGQLLACRRLCQQILDCGERLGSWKIRRDHPGCGRGTGRSQGAV